MASFSVVNNISSMNAQSNLQVSNVGLQKALTRLSSGLRINSSGDDAAGLAVANGYRAQVANLNQGIRNANDGLSTLQIVDGALNNISTLLDRMASLASQSASTNFSGSRGVLDAEFQKLLGEITEEAKVAGLDTAAMSFSVFVGSGANITGTIGQADAAGLALTGATITGADDAAAVTAAEAALTSVMTAVETLGTVQGSVGSLQNTLQYRISLAQTQVVNIKAAESRIRDANIAEESANMTRFNILNQSGVAALAQANQSSASLLSLLR